MKTGKELMETWFEQVWNRGNEALIAEMMSESCEIKGLGLAEKGPAAFMGFYQTFQSTFESIRIELIEQVEEGERVFANCRFTARHRERGQSVEMMFTALGRWREGKLIEACNVVDFLTLLVQLEEVEVSALAKVLS